MTSPRGPAALARGGLPLLHTLYKGCPGFSPGRKFLTQKDKESIFTMDHFPLWYRRAAEHPAGSFIYSIVSEDDSGNPSLNTRAEERGRQKLFFFFFCTSHRAFIPTSCLLGSDKPWPLCTIAETEGSGPRYRGGTKLEGVGKAVRAA